MMAMQDFIHSYILTLMQPYLEYFQRQAKFSSYISGTLDHRGCITLPLYFFFSLVLLLVNTSTLTGVAIFISLIEE